MVCLANYLSAFLGFCLLHFSKFLVNRIYTTFSQEIQLFLVSIIKSVSKEVYVLFPVEQRSSATYWWKLSCCSSYWRLESCSASGCSEPPLTGSSSSSSAADKQQSDVFSLPLSNLSCLFLTLLSWYLCIIPNSRLCWVSVNTGCNSFRPPAESENRSRA